MKTVLVVDDELPLQKLCARELRREGYAVTCATSGREAHRKAHDSHPDIVVMDIRMPEMDGLSAMGRILEDDNEIPVVIYTSFPMYKDNFLSWSADAYLTKSSDLSELKETIRSLLAHRKN